MIGQTLSHFKIVAKLGEGGMGEVYRAEDTKLGREVAIKVLPEAVAQDPERLARFQREAQVLAALNHPNIAGIHQIEEADGKQVLVMELVEGEDLSVRLARGPVPVEDSQPIALQIAEALEAAHEQGIIHRDLKPANIKVKADGQVKILDFGLAKALDPGSTESSAPGLSMSPTLTAQMTQAGVLLGTAAYMSPEQAKGIEADRRADVWAFGVVLWEMLTGKRLFEGDSVSDTLAAVLRDELDGSDLPAETPQTTRVLLARCLDRDPKSRLRDIGEARIALTSSSSGESTSTLMSAIATPTPEPSTTEYKPAKTWPLIAASTLAAVAILVAIVLALGTLDSQDRVARRIESALLPPEGNAFDLGSGLALSPDGTQVAFVAIDANGVRHLWVQSLDRSEAQKLDDTQGVMYPFWSPDNKHLGFFTRGQLHRISAGGGPAQTITRVNDARGGAWNENGEIVFAPNFRDALYIIDAAGGEPEPLTHVDMERREIAHRFPVFLPGGKHLLFLSQTAEGGTQRDDSRIELLSMETRERTPLIDANSSVVYSSSGHLLYWHGGSLMAVQFDSDSRVLTGDPVPVADEVGYTGNEFGTFSVSQNGLMIFQRGSQSGSKTRFEIVDMAGQVLGEPSTEDYHREIALSHDGGRVVYRSADNITLWIRDLERDTTSRFTFEDGDHRSPIWSPDDDWVMYVSDRDGPFRLYRRRSSGAGEEEILLEVDNPLVAWDWSGDGNKIALEVRNPETDQDIAIYSIDEEELEFVVKGPLSDSEPQISPDGRWLAYFSTESGGFEVYLLSLDGTGGKYQISTEGGLHPEWDPKGDRLFYMNLSSEIMAVDLQLEDRVEIGLPQKLFSVRFPVNSEYPFRIRPDGETFVINQVPEHIASDHMVLVQNWSTLLDRD